MADPDRQSSSVAAENEPQANPAGERANRWKRLRRWLLRGVIAFALPFLLYGLLVLIGLIPVNSGFSPSQDGIKIYIVSSDVHADFVLPIKTDKIDWRDEFPDANFKGDTSAATHVAIGWGDQGFYLETPTWADLKVSTAIKALFFPSPTCLHVYMTRPEVFTDARPVLIDEDQYAELVRFILASFVRSDNGDKQRISDFSYGQNDAFFDAVGSYNCVNTCNAWIGRGMKRAGIKTPWIAPLPRTVLRYLPEAD